MQGLQARVVRLALAAMIASLASPLMAQAPSADRTAFARSTLDYFIWEDADDEYAALVTAWWVDGFPPMHEDINRGGGQFLRALQARVRNR